MFLRALLLAGLTLPLQCLTRSAYAEETCVEVLASPAAEVKRCLGNLSVVRLRGDPVTRARAMGELLRGPLSAEVVNYFAYKVTGLAAEEAGFAGKIAGLLYNQVVRLFHRRTPVGFAEEIDAMALGMGIDPIVLKRGLSLPDTGVLLQGLGSHPWLEFLPSAGCTSAVARLPGGGMIWGRNLDFAGVGTFDRHPMLLSIEPGAGTHELRHLVIGADGLPFGGITGVNEAGIAFAVHQHFSRDVGVDGVPMILIGEQVLRYARTLEEAEEILRSLRPAAVWTFLVADLNKGEMLAVESSRRVFLTRRGEGEGNFVQTNHAMHEESRAWENGDTGTIGNSVHRMKVAFELLEKDKKPTAETVARALAFQENPDGFFSSYHDILKSETIQTVLFEAMPGMPRKIFLSVDEAPSSGGKFASFALEDFFREGPLPSPVAADLVKTPAEKRVRQREIARAYSAYFDLRRPLDAAAILESHPTLNAALFRSLASYRSGDYQQALTLAEQAGQNPRFVSEPAYIHESLGVLRLASYLRLGRHDDARRVAEQLEAKGPVKSQTKRLVAHVLRNQAPPRWMLNLGFNFFSGDLGGRKD